MNHFIICTLQKCRHAPDANENIYEFIFGKETEELWGDEWDARPAHGKPGPPELQYIESVGVLNNTLRRNSALGGTLTIGG